MLHGVTCHKPAREHPSKYMGGGGASSGRGRLTDRPSSFLFWGPRFFYSGGCFLGGSREPFSWPETGRTFRDHGGSPRLSAPQGGRFLGAESVTIFWARNRALVAPFFLCLGSQKECQESTSCGVWYTLRYVRHVHTKVTAGPRFLLRFASGQTTSMRTPFLTTCRCEP